VAGPAAQRLDQLQGDADAGQVLVGIGAVVALRVDHCQRRRQRRVGLVMVGDDQVDAELARPHCRLDAADPAVDRDDQLDAVRMQPFDGRRLEPVAVAQSLRDEMGDVGAEQFQRPPQDHGGGDAVDVVVAVDRDAILSLNRREHTLDRIGHAGQRERIVQIRQ
jgi:hypothetical protein